MTILRCKKVYAFHATLPQYKSKIEQVKKFRVGPRSLYGTGVYFWEKRKDAEEFGKIQYGSAWVIFEQKLLIIEPHTWMDWGIYWPLNDKPFFNNIDGQKSAHDFSISMRNAGTQIVVIRAETMSKTTLPNVQGDAFCWLGNPDEYISLDYPSFLANLPDEVDHLPPSGQWYEVSVRLPGEKGPLMSESEYRERLNTIYDKHLGNVTKRSNPYYIYQQAGKIYNEIYSLNYDTEHWNHNLKYGDYDHELAYFIACRIKYASYSSIANLSKKKLAQNITDLILAYLEDKKHYGFLHWGGKPYLIREDLFTE